MILADTSVWVRHYREAIPEFSSHLFNAGIAIHSVVIGELATGNLRQRATTLKFLSSLPRIPDVNLADCLAFIEAEKLHGLGIGWNDTQLLASLQRAKFAKLWTLDKRLAITARKLGLAFDPS